MWCYNILPDIAFQQSKNKMITVQTNEIPFLSELRASLTPVIGRNEAIS